MITQDLLLDLARRLDQGAANIWDTPVSERISSTMQGMRDRQQSQMHDYTPAGQHGGYQLMEAAQNIPIVQALMSMFGQQEEEAPPQPSRQVRPEHFTRDTSTPVDIPQATRPQRTLRQPSVQAGDYMSQIDKGSRPPSGPRQYPNLNIEGLVNDLLATGILQPEDVIKYMTPDQPLNRRTLSNERDR